MTAPARPLAALVAAALAFNTEAALAQPKAADTDKRAADLYQQGARLLQDRKAKEALEALDASLSLSPSPNTALVRAHALRLLGRRVEAMDAYQTVTRDAGERVRGGDERMRDTLADAGRWIALLRAELGEVSVEVTGAPAGLSIAIDGRPADVTRDADGVSRARRWHEPGAASVTVRGADGRDRTSAADVTAGGVATVRIELGAPAGPAPSSSSGPPLGTWLTWGIGAASLGVFAAFGTLAGSAASKLDPCRPSCPESLRGVAADGERDALIANIALGAGGIALTAGTILWLTAPGTVKPAAGAFLSVSPTSAGIGLTGSF